MGTRENPHVLVVGGGPSGSTAAALLARSGVQVTLLERDTFPRYHIGESLLASCLSTLRVSGAYDKVAAHGFQIKRGGYFQWQHDTWLLDWSKLVDAEAWSWQVDRAEFDDLLLRNASEQGAQVIEQAKVTRIVFDGERPIAAEWVKAGDDTVHTLEFDFLVDATGRDGLLAKHFDMRRSHPAFRNVAVWSYWKGAHLHPESPEGAINVASTEEGGWFWNIPLADGRNSVGYVVSAKVAAEKLRGHDSRTSYYLETIAASKPMSDMLEGAQQIAEVKAEQDYSYVADRFCGPGYVLVGDAACFLDPLLSTGVHLATYSGLVSAAAIATTLRGEMSEADALAYYEYTYRRGYTRFLSLVSRMYEHYVGSEEYFAHAHRLTDVYSGDSPEQSFTRIMAGLTDVGETTGVQERTGTEVIASEAERLHTDPDTDGVNIKYMGGLDMSPVWDHWRDPLVDTDMGETRITTEPVFGLTTRPRTDAERDAVARPVLPPQHDAAAAH